MGIRMSEKVAVLLSTYDGGKYIIDQLESLRLQTYQNYELFIRDDGSNDSTVDIIEKYLAASCMSATIIAEDNLGFVQSFFKLLTYCDDASYYAFCDQDDIWIPQKLEMAVELLNGTIKSKPVLYFSDYDYYNSDMEFVGHSSIKNCKPSFLNSLVDNVVVGATCVINKDARDRMIGQPMPNSCFHDWTAYMICSGLGEVIFDKRCSLKFRRHGENSSSCGKGGMNLFLWRMKKFFFSDYFYKIKAQLVEFDNLFGKELEQSDHNILKLFSVEGQLFKNEIRKCFYHKKFRQKWTDELLLRLIFLMKKL